MSKPKIIVVLNEGVIECVYTSTELDLAVVDIDEEASDPVKIVSDYETAPIAEFRDDYADEIADYPELQEIVDAGGSAAPFAI